MQVRNAEEKRVSLCSSTCEISFEAAELECEPCSFLKIPA
jgi:hypothetical protein